MEAPVAKPKKKIAILYTGGTIGCKWDENGDLNPMIIPGEFQDLITKYVKDVNDLYLQVHPKGLQEHPERFVLPEFNVITMDRTIDSSNLTVAEMIEIGDWVGELLGTTKAKPRMKKYGVTQKFDGVLVLHGTDTLAFTAAYLGIRFGNISKSTKRRLVITGSQHPFVAFHTDAKQQLISAMILASNEKIKIKQPVVYFDNKVFRACRVTKVDCENQDAFESPNFPMLGKLTTRLSTHYDTEVVWNPYYSDLFTASAQTRDFVRAITGKQDDGPRVGIIKLYPGISRDVVDAFARQHDAIIIEGFGTGNGPDVVRSWIKERTDSFKEGPHIFVATQCLRGTVRPIYGTTLGDEIGIGDMTTEAAFAKLVLLLSAYGSGINEKSKNQFIEIMTMNIAGEITN